MAGIGFAALWGAYTLGLWGYCIITGKNVTLGQLVNPVHQYKWPKSIPQIPDTQILPSKNTGGTQTDADT